MNRIYEVTAWRGGFIGMFATPVRTLVWAAAPEVAFEIALRTMEAKRTKRKHYSQFSIVPAREQDPVAHGHQVVAIVNLPMEMVELTWERLSVPPGQRTGRPIYVML